MNEEQSGPPPASEPAEERPGAVISAQGALRMVIGLLAMWTLLSGLALFPPEVLALGDPPGDAGLRLDSEPTRANHAELDDGLELIAGELYSFLQHTLQNGIGLNIAKPSWHVNRSI